MAINKSDYSAQLAAYEQSLRVLTEISKQNNLPEALKVQVLALKKNFENYDMEQHRTTLKKLTGKTMGLQELQKIIINATGYTKWHAFENTEEINIDFFKNEHGVDLNAKECKAFHFSREMKNRNDIFFIECIVMPGHAYIDLATDRAGYSLEYLIPNVDIQNAIEREFC